MKTLRGWSSPGQIKLKHVSCIGRAELIPFFIFVMSIGNFEFCVLRFENAQRLNCYKAIVNLPIRVKGDSERISVNLLSALEAPNEDLGADFADATNRGKITPVT